MSKRAAQFFGFLFAIFLGRGRSAIAVEPGAPVPPGFFDYLYPIHVPVANAASPDKQLMVIVNAMQIILSAVSLIAVIAMVLGGLILIFSAGNSDRVDRAKQSISGALVGLALIAISWALTATIVEVIGRTTINVPAP